MICKTCGMSADETKIFCANCGSKLMKETSTANVSQPSRVVNAVQFRQTTFSFLQRSAGRVSFNSCLDIGELNFYSDRIEYTPKRSRFGFPLFPKPTPIVYFYKNIKNCTKGVYAVASPYVSLEMRSGEIVSFSTGYAYIDKLHTIKRMVDEIIINESKK